MKRHGLILSSDTDNGTTEKFVKVLSYFWAEERTACKIDKTATLV